MISMQQVSFFQERTITFGPLLRELALQTVDQQALTVPVWMVKIFNMINGADLPSFLNGDYFYEAPLPNPIYAPMWDGLNCVGCCDFGSPPYFTKVLDAENDEVLEVKICVQHGTTRQPSSDMGVYFMDVYVK